jgi:hypothetical protein
MMGWQILPAYKAVVAGNNNGPKNIRKTLKNEHIFIIFAAPK